MTNEKAIMCLEDMKIKVPIPKAAKQARENNEALDVAIKALKNEPHWIPVTDALPQANEEVLITLSFGDIITMGWINKDGEWLIYEGNENADINDILAWQPLPEPYKEVTT